MKMKRSEKKILTRLENENLHRFAGSSDEEDEEKPMAPPAPLAAGLDKRRHADGEYDDRNSDTDDDGDDGSDPDDEDSGSETRNMTVGNDDADDLSSVEGEEPDPASKMANAMSRILGAETNRKDEKAPPSSSVVLAKTITPLQKLQQKEKELQKAMKEKRRANRERNLTALHLPLSIATTNNIESGGQLSVAKELEQERFHRRVATRGVVALFNAITQHQRNSITDKNNSNVSSKNKETSKLTKHGFLDKIKAAAKTKGSEARKETETSKAGKNSTENRGTSRSSWGALQDDYMLGSKKNWDEESSEEEPVSESEIEVKDGSKSRKKRRISRSQ